MLRPGSRAPAPAPQPAPSATATPVQASSGLIIPVAGVSADQLTDTWGQSRGGGSREHHAIDIMAPRGTPVIAAAPGRVEKLFESDNGGHTVYVRSPDGSTVYYYAHLDAYRPGLAEGKQVRTGEQIATVGSTGDASPEAPHLHFEIKRMGAGQGWWQGQEVNPYPLLAGQPGAR
ncbi:peptidoglycan DD-metalloendopeptidase family protein [Sphingomonas sp. MAH-20]|uniref:Peptidoglycan DD-metalloendopeptidase family protein n=2 Tax=Sphingomonadaceae TaxID=41297 RepID=A0A6I4J1N0_9SPHN|nr:M23 family metallopeptidase [Sphingomonas sp. CGMCC 1.13658]MVO78562.1 peptidoglycan DD-metalloendopeptidase family protein [Sphingomonas horti]